MAAQIQHLEVVRAGNASLRPVLRYCLAHARQGPVELERHVSAFLDYARAMSIDLRRLWIARKNTDDIAGAACIVSPGRTAMLLLPTALALGSDEIVIRALAHRAMEDVFEEDVRLLQVLLEENDDIGRSALEACGFQEIALLLYLEYAIDPSAPSVDLPSSVNMKALYWVPYGEATHVDFERTIVDTYVGSADCPGLSELRRIGDVIEGHKSAGRFDPAQWKLLKCDNEPMACLLVAQNPLRPVLEIVYMGVRPAHRRKNIGGHLISEVLNIAQHQRIKTVTLAVDARNEAGRRLYGKFGFRETARRRAMIRVNPRD